MVSDCKGTVLDLYSESVLFSVAAYLGVIATDVTIIASGSSAASLVKFSTNWKKLKIGLLSQKGDLGRVNIFVPCCLLRARHYSQRSGWNLHLLVIISHNSTKALEMIPYQCLICSDNSLLPLQN